MIRIQVLTRSGCHATGDMIRNLEAALARCGIEVHPEIVDLGTLAASDPRTGCGSPTVLVGGNDLFGMELPVPAAPT